MRKESFDSTKGSLLDWVIWRMRAQRMRRHIQDRVGVAVDLGCGRTAPLLRQLMESGLIDSAVGVDLNPAMDLETEVGGASLEMMRADLNSPLPIETGSVDLVLSLAVIEHLTQPDLHLKEIHRILRPGGRLLLTTPSPLGKPVLEFLAYRLRVIDRREIEDHKTYFNTGMLLRALVKAGFDGSQVRADTFQFGMNNSVVALR